MCTDEQHQEKLAALKRIETLLVLSIKGRQAIDRNYSVSDTQGFVLDYQDRKHLYIYSSAAITLVIQNIGTVAVSANAWTNLDFREGIKLFTNGTANPVNVLVRATDEVIA